MNIIILVMTMTIIILIVMRIMMMMTKILAITYIMSKFTMVDDQQDDGYEDYDAEDFDQDHDPLYDYD